MKAIEYLEYLQENIYSKSGYSPDASIEKLKKIYENIMEKVFVNHEGIVPKEIIETTRINQKKEFDKMMALKLPTKYEDRIEYSIILDVSRDIEKSVHEIELTGDEMKDIKKLKDLNLNIVTPFFGTLTTGNVNAKTCFCDDGYLIIFESEIFYFCNLLSKIVVSSFPFENTLNNPHLVLDENAVLNRLENNPEILRHFWELIIGYVIGGSPRSAPQYVAEGPYSTFASVMTQAMERFVMGHEYSHILLRHKPVRNGQIGLANIQDVYYKMFSWPQEYTADYLGLQLMFHAMNRNGNTNLGVNYCSVEVFFMGFEIMNRAISILKRGNDDWYWKEGKKDGSLGTHPPFHYRRAFTHKLISTKYGENFVKASILAELVVNNLWANIKPYLKSMYEKGQRAHPKWMMYNM